MDMNMNVNVNVGVSIIESKIESIFIKHGFSKNIVNNRVNFVHNGKYRMVTYIEGLQVLVIEYAESLGNAQKNIYEDGDHYPISLGDSLIAIFEEDLINFML